MTYYEPPLTFVQMIETPLTTMDDHEESQVMLPLPPPAYHPGDALQRRMIFILLFALSVIGLFTALVLPGLLADVGSGENEAAADWPVGVANPGGGKTAVVANGGAISPIFAAAVQHWEPQIVEWAAAFNLDPDIVATIMQIESCGYPQAISSAGAQGLFQVMPFHFTAGENMLDPATNARRGLAYYVEGLDYHSGNLYLSFAGYNGGHGTAAKGWDQWANETQRYYVWSKGIYEDAKAGLTASPTLQQWLQAGGANLCRQAEQALQIAQ